MNEIKKATKRVKKIDSLTKEQESQMGLWADIWIEKSKCTDPTNREEFEDGCKKCYEYSGERWHNNVVYVDNPCIVSLAGTTTGYILEQFYANFENIVKHVGSDREKYDGAFKECILSNADTFLDKLFENVSDEELFLEYNIQKTKECVLKILDNAYFDIIDDFKAETTDKNKVYEAIAKVFDVNIKLEKKKIFANWNKYIGGTLWLSWQAYESFFDVICGLDHDKLEEARAYRKAQENAGHWFPHSFFTIVSERPNTICLKKDIRFSENQILHCEDGPAFAYKGLNMYFINGVKVNEQIVMHPETLTVEQINSEQNKDVQSIMIDRFGGYNYIKESDSVCIDKRKDEITGYTESLYESPVGKRLVVVCPTVRMYALGVPDNIKTCQEAQDYLSGERKFRVLHRT